MGRKGGTIHNGSGTRGVNWGHPDTWPWGLHWSLVCWLDDSLLPFLCSKPQCTDPSKLPFPGCLAHQLLVRFEKQQTQAEGGEKTGHFSPPLPPPCPAPAGSPNPTFLHSPSSSASREGSGVLQWLTSGFSHFSGFISCNTSEKSSLH